VTSPWATFENCVEPLAGRRRPGADGAARDIAVGEGCYKASSVGMDVAAHHIYDTIGSTNRCALAAYLKMSTSPAPEVRPPGG